MSNITLVVLLISESLDFVYCFQIMGKEKRFDSPCSNNHWHSESFVSLWENGSTWVKWWIDDVEGVYTVFTLCCSSVMLIT